MVIAEETVVPESDETVSEGECEDAACVTTGGSHSNLQSLDAKWSSQFDELEAVLDHIRQQGKNTDRKAVWAQIHHLTMRQGKHTLAQGKNVTILRDSNISTNHIPAHPKVNI